MRIDPDRPGRRTDARSRGLLPGLSVAAGIAVVATAAGRQAPLVGAPVFAIVIGLIVGPLAVRRRPSLSRGLAVAARTLLQLAVVLLGAQLSLREVVVIGRSSLPVMLGTLLACFVAAAVVGRWLGVDRELRTLIGVGTGICGASAIAAVTSVIGPSHRKVAYAISTIFVFNIVAVLVFPPLGHLLGLDQEQFGLFVGTAVNDTSSVVAAATAYGDEASDHAVVVKLTRSLMIIPICLVLGAIVARARRISGDVTTSKRRIAGLVPWFLVGFVLLAGIGTAGLLSATVTAVLHHAAVFLIAMAMAGIGCSVDVRGLRDTGLRPLLLGACLWLTVSLASLSIQLCTA